jgi:hypothetical protein
MDRKSRGVLQDFDGMVTITNNYIHPREFDECVWHIRVFCEHHGKICV